MSYVSATKAGSCDAYPYSLQLVKFFEHFLPDFLGWRVIKFYCCMWLFRQAYYMVFKAVCTVWHVLSGDLEL